MSTFDFPTLIQHLIFSLSIFFYHIINMLHLSDRYFSLSSGRFYFFLKRVSSGRLSLGIDQKIIFLSFISLKYCIDKLFSYKNTY